MSLVIINTNYNLSREKFLDYRQELTKPINLTKESSSINQDSLKWTANYSL